MNLAYHRNMKRFFLQKNCRHTVFGCICIQNISICCLLANMDSLMTQFPQVIYWKIEFYLLIDFLNQDTSTFLNFYHMHNKIESFIIIDYSWNTLVSLAWYIWCWKLINNFWKTLWNLFLHEKRQYHTRLVSYWLHSSISMQYLYIFWLEYHTS